MRFLRITVFAVATVFGIGAVAAPSASASRPGTVTAWAPGMADGGRAFGDETVRAVVPPTASGTGARIRISNTYGTVPLVIDSAGVGLQASGPAVAPGTAREVRFTGRKSVTVAAGREVLSDPVPLTVGPDRSVLVSIHVPGTTGPSTWHSDAFRTSYSADGNRVRDTGGQPFTRTATSWFFVSGLYLESAVTHRTVVAFGDSITDGFITPVDAGATWPDRLSGRLGRQASVVNAGIGGNRVLTDAPDIWQGLSARKRFRHDALDVPGVATVVLVEGINDIGNNAGPGGTDLTAADLIDGYRTLIGQARAAGIRIVGGTLLPMRGAEYFTEHTEALRQQVNSWIRTAGAFDAVADFDASTRSAADPIALNPAYDSGDHLHPNAAGMAAMANAIDPATLFG
ncbi:SGNH/GDSL hydrolase family protein [Amycolatopsis jiangsuensis]|uniref:Lysophospholipase L1-like esterase n=1 Tax=Amycolatopsis jiangsuensis TaxID=1181879 RepID=A0A840J4R5_9PSEU|nr:SGNH/GDSL hydrolase family protein [Amycolatopsis jiangsuensis]MBB4688719.1 lysophospholipase L1-like esterase [Amycolatopsis jiangsuensis]